MSEETVGNAGENGVEHATYNPRTLIRISSFSTLLAWAFIVLAAIIFGFGLYILYSGYVRYPYAPGLTDVLPTILALVFIILLCLFFAAQLFASSERLFILMDIQENTYQAGSEAGAADEADDSA
jgi:amino acid permease